MTTSQPNRPIKLIVTVTVRHAGQVLLVKYDPTIDGQSGWILPTSTLPNELHPDHIAKQVLLEQVGLAPRSLRLSHVESFVGRDGTWHIPLHYVADPVAGSQVVTKSPVSEARWFPRDSLPPAQEQSHGGWSGDIIKDVIANGF